MPLLRCWGYLPRGCRRWDCDGLWMGLVTAEAYQLSVFISSKALDAVAIPCHYLPFVVEVYVGKSIQASLGKYSFAKEPPFMKFLCPVWTFAHDNTSRPYPRNEDDPLCGVYIDLPEVVSEVAVSP